MPDYIRLKINYNLTYLVNITTINSIIKDLLIRIAARSLAKPKLNGIVKWLKSY